MVDLGDIAEELDESSIVLGGGGEQGKWSPVGGDPN
jgi:hypothetical protein